MVNAYIFIETEHGMAIKVVERAREIKGVKSCDGVTGPYDAIALVKSQNISLLGEVIVAQIQHIPGVVRTLTNIVCT